MKALIRTLNERGVARFDDWLKAGATGDAPFNLLSATDTSDPVIGTGEIEQRSFQNRYELALHVLESLDGCDFNRLTFDQGLWSWLSLFYIDLLCPKDLTGVRKVLAVERYVFDPAFHRAANHLVRQAVVVVKIHGSNAKVLLISPRGGIKDTETLSELGARQELIANTAVIELACRCYFDPSRGTLRHGAASRRRPGSVRRFAKVAQQLSLNYDLPAMNARQIADLLPVEFDVWKRRARLEDEPKGARRD